MDCSTPGLPVHHHVPGLDKTHVHWVEDVIQLFCSVISFSSCLQSFPASGTFLMSQVFASGSQSIGDSALVLPMSIQGGFTLDWLVGSPCCPKDSQESSPTPQFKSINSWVLSLLNGPTLTSIHDYWKNHSFDYMDLCQLSLLFNILFRFVITFLPRSKCLLIDFGA